MENDNDNDNNDNDDDDDDNNDNDDDDNEHENENENEIKKKDFFDSIYKWAIINLIDKKILQKAKERYSKEKAAEYYLQNKEAIKEKARDRYRKLSEEEKNQIKEYQKKKYQELVQYKTEALKNIFFLSVYNIKMNEKTL